MAWGLEARVPFLDKDFIQAAMVERARGRLFLFSTFVSQNIDPMEKMHRHGQKDAEGRPLIEKYIMRKAFDTPERPYLPDEVLWRQKEQFSDGCGYGWIDTLKAEAELRVTDEQMRGAAQRFPHLTPQTKEAYWFRTIFHDLVPQGSAEKTVMAWTPSWSTSKDPSGRAQKVHEQALQK
jgi:asparagine synthase (glutamine-hydrolysing)